MLSHGLFSLLTERLMLHSSHFTMTMYNVLFEVCMLPICPRGSCLQSESFLLTKHTLITSVFSHMTHFSPPQYAEFVPYYLICLSCLYLKMQ